MHNQTAAEHWSKKPRLAKRVKATEIFKSDPRKPQAQGGRKTLGTMQNLKFHGEETRICSKRRKSGKHLPRSRPQHHSEVKKPSQSHEREQETTQLFSSEFVCGSSQNVMTDEVSVSFRPAFVSTPCAKNSSRCPKMDAVLKDITTKPNSNLEMLIPDPSPNVFRWCSDAFAVLPVEHQSIRSTTAKEELSPLKNPDPPSQDVNAMQLSFEKLLVEQSNPHHSDTTKSGDESILASETPIHDGEYVMPYYRANT